MISPAAIAAMADGSAIVSGAVAFMTSPEPVRVWGGYGVLPIAGHDYHGLGDRAFAQVTGGAVGGSEQNVTLILSGIDPENALLLDQDEIKGVSTVIYRLIFDGSGTILLDARPYKRGRVDDINLEEVLGGDSEITVQIESAARGLGLSNGRMRSDADQRLIDPNDGFFKHVTYAGEKLIYFGGKKTAAKSATS